MLEERITVLVGAAHGGVLGVEGVLAERLDSVHVAHVGEILIIPHSDLLDFVGGAETVEEVDEGHLAGKSGQMRNGERSMTSCTLPSHSMAKPVWRQAITSE